MNATPLLWCLVAAALFGAQAPAAKALLSGLSPLALAGVLYLGAAAFTLPFSFRGGSPEARRRRGNVLRLSGAVVTGGVLGPVLMLFALQGAPAGHVALWLNLETVATALLGVWIFHEPLGRRGTLSVVLVTAGSVVLAWRGGYTFAFEAVLVTFACVAWGLDNHLTALIDGYTPAQSTCVKGLAGGVTNLGLAFVVGDVAFAVDLVGYGLLVGALSYGASLVLYVAGAQHLGATRSQMAFATAPFFGVAIAWTFGGEPVLPMQVVAAALMAVALVVMARERHGHEHSHEAVTHTHWHRHDDLHHEHDHADGGPRLGWHVHEHTHAARQHTHPHRPDLHHRHEHGVAER